MTYHPPTGDNLVDEVTGLTLACLSGDADHADAARLDELLRSSDKACRVYVRVVFDSSGLRGWVAAERSSSEELLDPQQLLALAGDCFGDEDRCEDGWSGEGHRSPPPP